MFSTLYYEGRQYPARIVMIPGHGERVIATQSLQDELWGNGSGPVDEEAESVDNGVFFYVEDDNITLGDADLARVVMDCLADMDGKSLSAYLHLPRCVLRKWNDLLWSDGHVDFKDLGVEPRSDVARWSVKFEDGFSADIRIISGRVNTLRTRALLFDPEGRRVSCTGAVVAVDLDGEWILWDGDNSYHVYVMEGDDDEQKEA